MDNRSRLLECALDLFTARGYDAVGVQEIVDAAGYYQADPVPLLWQ